MKSVVFATTNKGKLEEARRLAQEYGVALIDPSEIVKERGLPPQVNETGKTYEENSLLKAAAFFEWSGGTPTIADDAGLEVEFLKGEPGVGSARYADGEKVSNIEKLLGAIGSFNNRRAEFVSCLTYLDSNKEPIIVKKRLQGSIANTPSGKGGFGYDPIFVVDGYKETLAALKERGVLVDTHRIKAFRAMFELLKGTDL